MLMEKDNFVTKVVFRKYKDGDLIAIFPEVIDNYPYHVGCYQKVGQHGQCDYAHIMSETKKASPNDYSDMKQELESHYGYVFKVMKQCWPQYRKAIRHYNLNKWMYQGMQPIKE